MVLEEKYIIFKLLLCCRESKIIYKISYASEGNNIKIDGNLAFNVMAEFPFLL